MSWSTSLTSVPAEDVIDKLEENLNSHYPEAEEDVRNQWGIGFSCVDRILAEFAETSNTIVRSVSVNGHAKQSENEGNSIGISVSV